MTTRSSSFAEFWPFYLREHSKPQTRALHYIGTLLSVAVVIVAIALGAWWVLILYPIVGYGFAWIGHYGIEKNRPATFTHPWWSLLSDYKMTGLWLTGRLGPELDRAGVTR